MNELIISDASESDIEDIHYLERTSFASPYPKSLLRAYLFIAQGLFLVAKERGRIVGYCIGVVQHKYRGHVISIASEAGSRRRGIGSALLEELERRFARLGCKYSYLEVAYDNVEAITFYRRRGYIAVRLRKNYYARNKHALVMIKPLTTGILE